MIFNDVVSATFSICILSYIHDIYYHLGLFLLKKYLTLYLFLSINQGQCNDWCSWVGPKRDGFGLDPRYRERTETDYFACKLSGGHTSEDGYTDKEFFKDGFHYQKCSGKGAETPDYTKEKFMGCFNEDINNRA